MAHLLESSFSKKQMFKPARLRLNVSDAIYSMSLLMHLRLMAKFSGQLGRLGLWIFWPIFDFIWLFWGSGGFPLASQHPGDSNGLMLSPIRRIWVQFRQFFMKFVIL